MLMYCDLWSKEFKVEQQTGLLLATLRYLKIEALSFYLIELLNYLFQNTVSSKQLKKLKLYLKVQLGRKIRLNSNKRKVEREKWEICVWPQKKDKTNTKKTF